MSVRRLLPLGALVAALLVVAAIASRGRPLSAGHGTGPDATFFDYVATTLVLVGIAVAVFAVWAVLMQRPGSPGLRRGKWDVLAAIALVMVCSFFAYLVSTSTFVQRLRSLEQRTHGTQPRHTGTAPPRATGTGGRNPRLRWDEIGVVLAIVGGVGIYLLATRTRGRDLQPLVRRRQAAVARAVDESLDDLRSDPDVRRAIIAAYARMERALGGAGLPRAPAEAPFEYVGRALVELEAGAAPARRLTDLFERAKFSQHEPGEPMRDEAIGALVAVRDALAAPA